MAGATCTLIQGHFFPFPPWVIKALLHSESSGPVGFFRSSIFHANVKVHHRKFKFIQNSATFEAIEVINHRILSIDHLSRDTLKVAQLIYLWYTIYFQSNQNRKCRFQGRVAAAAPQCNEDLFPGGAVASNSRNCASVCFQLVHPRRWQGMGRDV